MRKKIALISLVISMTVVFASCGYNSIISNDEAVKKAWGDYESQLQRRSDLIPSLVGTVKGAANFEQKTLTAVIEARSKATAVTLKVEDLDNPEAVAKFQEAQSQLSGSLSRLLVSVEAYPELKANQNFLGLQSQLEGTENRINVSRERFNEAVASFNKSIRKLPYNFTNMIFFKYKPKEVFKADAASKVAPVVDFE